jgi:TniQ
MFLVPKILPNEFAPAYLKVFSRFNHPRPPRDRDSHLPESLRKWYLGNCSVADLSLVGGIGLGDLLKEHTLQHFLRQLILRVGRHWKPIDDSTFASLPVMHSARMQAFFCPRCSESDLDQFGRSYWHTDHQLPGVHECLIHRGTILKAVDNWAHLELWRAPGEVHNESFMQSNWQEWMRDDAVLRYVEVALSLARWEGDLSHHDLVPLFRTKLSEFGLHSSKLPRFVASKFPSDWLENLVSPRHKANTSPIFGLTTLSNTSSGAPRRTFVCVVAAALWPTASEGIAALAALDAAS